MIAVEKKERGSVLKGDEEECSLSATTITAYCMKIWMGGGFAF
jgi:hypothetical protein